MSDESRLERVLHERRRRRILHGVAGTVLLLGAALAWFWGWLPIREELYPEQAEPLEEHGAMRGGEAAPPREAQPAAETPPPIESADAVAVALPELDQSDGFVRAAAAALSSNPEIARWLSNDELIRRFVVAVDNVAQGRSPRIHLLFLAPEDPFAVIGDELGDEPVLVDPRTYARYDPVAAAVDGLDARGCAQLFAMLLPLMQEAYVDLGYPDHSFEARLEEAAYELLSTPIPTGPVRLIPRVRRFEYEDRALEDLSDAQKQLLRMGPDGAARMQRKLREVLSLIDPAWPAPPARMYEPREASEAG